MTILGVLSALMELLDITNHSFNPLRTAAKLQVLVQAFTNTSAHILQVSRREVQALVCALVAASKACFQRVAVDDLAFPPAYDPGMSCTRKAKK